MNSTFTFFLLFLVPFYHLTVCISFRAFPTPYVSEFLAVKHSSYNLFLWKLPAFFQNLTSDDCDFQAILKDTETKNVNIPAGTKFKQWEDSSYLFVSVIVWVNVIVKLLVFIVLLVTECTVEVGFQIFQGFCYRVFLFSIILEGNGKVILVYSSDAANGFCALQLIIFVNIYTLPQLKAFAYLLCYIAHIYCICWEAQDLHTSICYSVACSPRGSVRH